MNDVAYDRPGMKSHGAIPLNYLMISKDMRYGPEPAYFVGLTNHPAGLEGDKDRRFKFTFYTAEELRAFIGELSALIDQPCGSSRHITLPLRRNDAQST